jgi:hypothetical protein
MGSDLVGSKALKKDYHLASSKGLNWEARLAVKKEYWMVKRSVYCLGQSLVKQMADTKASMMEIRRADYLAHQRVEQMVQKWDNHWVMTKGD